MFKLDKHVEKEECDIERDRKERLRARERKKGERERERHTHIDRQTDRQRKNNLMVNLCRCSNIYFR